MTATPTSFTITDADGAPTPEVRQMRVGLLVIGLQFLVPAFSYAIDPGATVDIVHRLNVAMGGERWVEQGHLWNMLAFGNVATLGFLCLLIRADVRRFLPALPALLFLKLCSALFSLVIALQRDVPVFFAVFVLDGSTTLLMGALALRGAWSLAADQSAPWWARWLLLDPERVERGLARVEVARVNGALPMVPRTPNLWQILLGALAMWHRVVFRMETVGTSPDAPRHTWRARVLRHRAARLPFLLWERAIAPLDMSGLTLDRARLIHHLLAAHHDGAQAFYDLQLLALHGDDALLALRAQAHQIVDGTHPRATWLRDLCVFERYHEGIVEAVDAFRRGQGAIASRSVLADEDLSLSGTLAWCARQPATPRDTLARWRDGRFTPRFDVSAS